MLAYQVCEWTMSQVPVWSAIVRSAASVRSAGVGPLQQRIVLGVRDRARARIAHAVHLDLCELHELAYEEVDMHAGASVDVRWVLPGEDADAHVAM